MKRFHRSALFFTGLLVLLYARTATSQNTSDFVPFGISYEKIPVERAGKYNILIVEPGHYNASEVEQLKKTTGAKVLSYLSLGEVNPSRWYFNSLKVQGFLGRNENWGSFYINLADSATISLFEDNIIPGIMSKGFDGFFLDTITSVASYTGRSHLQPHMASIIAKLRKRYPGGLIIQNSGLFLLERTSPYIDAVMMENVASNYNFETKKYYLTEPSVYKNKVSQLRKVSKDYHIPVLIVDFADTETLKKGVISRLDTLQFPYFISRIELNNLSESISRRTQK